MNMAQFHHIVSALIDAFARGSCIIDRQRAWRTKEQRAIDPRSKSAEELLKKSLTRNESVIKQAYAKDLDQFGVGFASGDDDSRSSISAILLRLNAGFVSVIERFTHGRTTPNDYQVLLNLSNASRIDAVRTFEQLTYRLSQSSLALVPLPEAQQSRRRQKAPTRSKTSSSAAAHRPTKRRSKSTSEISVTAYGLVRPKAHRGSSSDYKGSKSSMTPLTKCSSSKDHKNSGSTMVVQKRCTSLVRHEIPRRSTPETPEKRKSIMSFASDSTKLGEIPPHKWACNAINEGEQFAIKEYFPLEPYHEPVKQRSRLRRLFRK